MRFLFFVAFLCKVFLVYSSTIPLGNNNASIANFDKDQMTKGIVDFLQPHKSEIQAWFWEISGNSFNNPAFGNGTGVGTMAEYITCEICVPALPLLKLLLDLGADDALIIDVIEAACVILNLAPKPEICRPTISSYATPILYIIQNRPDIPNNDFCGIINPGCTPISDHLKNWEISLRPKTSTKSVPRLTLPPSQGPMIKILQYTDMHLDLDYLEGRNAWCGLPVCCREVDGIPSDPNAAAGKWGHFSCEMPSDGMKALYKHGAETHKDTKMIFLTGDFIHSGIWLYGIEENTRHHLATTTWLREAFSEISPEIYPLVGNHEPDVVNMYPPEEVWGDFPLEWMYDSVSSAFGDFIPPDQMILFRKYGYYSVNSKSDENLRLIVLNTNLCYINNFWLPYDPIDTSGQLQWFADRLHEAEEQGQSVIVLGHIYPGSGSCWPIWSRQFERIIQRYGEIIRGQFYGHSHEQDYHLTFLQDGTPISVGHTGGSGVSDGMNSGYNVYYADGARGADSTWEIMNHETWVLNLTHSNAQPSADPMFNKILNAQELFGVSSLTPDEIYKFINRMVCDEELFIEYQKIKTKGADSPRYRPCPRNDGRCKAERLGNLFVSNSGDMQHKNRFEEYILHVDCRQETTINPTTTTGQISTDPSSTTANPTTDTGVTTPVSTTTTDVVSTTTTTTAIPTTETGVTTGVTTPVSTTTTDVVSITTTTTAIPTTETGVTTGVTTPVSTTTTTDVESTTYSSNGVPLYNEIVVYLISLNVISMFI